MVKSSIRTDTDDIVDGGGYINRHGDCSSRDGVGRLDCGTLRSDDAGRSGDVGYTEGDGAGGGCGAGGQAKGCVRASEGWSGSASGEDWRSTDSDVRVDMSGEVRGSVGVVANRASAILGELDTFGYLLGEGKA